MIRNVSLSHSEKQTIIVVLTAVNTFISVSITYVWFFLPLAQKVYVVPEEMDKYLRDTRLFWIVTIAVIIFLVLEVVATIFWLSSRSKLKELLIWVLTLIHLIALAYIYAPYLRYFSYLSLPLFFPLITTIILDPLLVWVLFPPKKNVL
jgi:hypothetical protein